MHSCVNTDAAGRYSASMMNHACHEVMFNEDLLAYTFEYLRVDESLAVRLVSQLFASSFMRSYGVRDKPPPLLQRTQIRHFCGSLPALQWSVTEMRARLTSQLFSSAAEAGCLTGLQWLRSQDPPCLWDANACIYAAQNGHLAVLQWLRSQNPPCSWDAVECCDYAVLYGRSDVVEWIDAQGV